MDRTVMTAPQARRNLNIGLAAMEAGVTNEEMGALRGWLKNVGEVAANEADYNWTDNDGYVKGVYTFDFEFGRFWVEISVHCSGFMETEPETWDCPGSCEIYASADDVVIESLDYNSELIKEIDMEDEQREALERLVELVALDNLD